MESATSSGTSSAFCSACKQAIDARAEICPKCGVRQKHTTRANGVINTGWILLFLAWVLFVIPFPGLGILGITIATVALIISIVIRAKGETRAGLAQLLFNLILSPIIYLVTFALFVGSIAATGQAKREQARDLREQVKKEFAEQSAQKLEQIVISDAKFYFQRGSYRKEPVIDFKIKNNSDFAVSEVSFRGVLSSPGRSIPWVDDNLRYEIKGGLEPGEEQRLELSPSRYSGAGWGNDDLAKRKDLVLTITVTGVKGADGGAIRRSP